MGEGPDVLLHPRPRRARRPRSSTPPPRSAGAATASTRSTCPGFGSLVASPRPAPYNARWFAETVVGVMDALGIERAHLVGNSMGGRVGARGRPARARARRRRWRCCVPAVAFVKRGCHPIVRAAAPGARPAAPPLHARAWSPRQFWSMFADPDARRPQRRRRRRRRVPAHLRARRRPPRLPGRGAQHLPRQALRHAAASTRAWPSSSRPRCSSGARTTALDPRRLQAPRRASGCPRAEQIVLDGLRPRAAGRAARAGQRAAPALLRPGRRARAPARRRARLRAA